jgi:hypothetical protein
MQNMNPPPSDREDATPDYGSKGLKFESSRVRGFGMGPLRVTLEFQKSFTPKKLNW